MSAVPAYDRASYLQDIKIHRGRGQSYTDIARTLGISRATLFRILAEAKATNGERS